MNHERMQSLRIWQEEQRGIIDKIRSTPLEEWHEHADIMDRVKREGFDIGAAIVRRDSRSRKEADNT